MAPHSSTLAWKIPWTEEPGRLQSIGSVESDTTERLHFPFSLSCIGEGNGNPLQYFCLENPRDGGAWWAAVYGVAQSQTWLKRLSSRSSSSSRAYSRDSVLAPYKLHSFLAFIAFSLHARYLVSLWGIPVLESAFVCLCVYQIQLNSLSWIFQDWSCCFFASEFLILILTEDLVQRTCFIDVCWFCVLPICSAKCQLPVFLIKKYFQVDSVHHISL